MAISHILEYINLGKYHINGYNLILSIFAIPLTFVGQDSKPYTETDNDSGSGTMTSYGSTNSLSSNSSAPTAGSVVGGVLQVPTDNPEQFEVLKQQKEVMEVSVDIICQNL